MENGLIAEASVDVDERFLGRLLNLEEDVDGQPDLFSRLMVESLRHDRRH